MSRKLILLLVSAILALSACSQQNTYSAQAARQNELAAAQKEAQLQPAVGNYCGTMHLSASDMDFAVNLNLQILPDNEHSSTSTDPTDTVQVPKLQGDMKFPAIQNLGSAAYATLPDLMAATGGNGAVSFTYGDYTPDTGTVTLPFSVAGHDQGDYGEVIGTLTGDKLTGKWFSNSSELVGTFTVSKNCGGSS